MNRNTQPASGDPYSTSEPGGKGCPPWVRLDGEQGRYVLIDEKRAVIETVFHRYLAGEGIASIAKTLNAARTRPWQGSTDWSPGDVRKILTDATLTGTIRQNEAGERVGDGLPQVISEEMFAEVQNRLAGHGPREGLAEQIRRRVGGCLNPQTD